MSEQPADKQPFFTMKANEWNDLSPHGKNAMIEMVSAVARLKCSCPIVGGNAVDPNCPLHKNQKKPSEPAREVKEIAAKIYTDWLLIGENRVVTELEELMATALQAERDRAACNTITSIGDAAEQIVELKASLEECRRVLEPLLTSYQEAKQRSSYSTAAAKWFLDMPGKWPIRLESTMAVCRAAATLLAKLTP